MFLRVSRAVSLSVQLTVPSHPAPARAIVRETRSLVAKLHDRAEEAEAAMREKLVRERDAQIQMVISKLNQERVFVAAAAERR